MFRVVRSQEDQAMFARLLQLCSSILVAAVLITSPIAKAGDDGIIKVKSAYPMRETIERLKTDIAGKGIKFHCCPNVERRTCNSPLTSKG